MSRPPSGVWGWCALTAIVVAWDAWALGGRAETMTGAFRRGVGHRHARWPIVLAWVLTTAHLLGPPGYSRIDPIHAIGDRLRK